MAREYQYKNRTYIVEKTGDLTAHVKSPLIDAAALINYIGNNQWKTITLDDKMITDTFIEGVNHACKTLARREDKVDEIDEFFLGDSS